MALYVPQPGHRTKPLTPELFPNVSRAADLCCSFLDDALANVEVLVKRGLNEHHSLETLFSSY
jgi:imidazoleglycerol phosphate dehydratase HisB